MSRRLGVPRSQYRRAQSVSQRGAAIRRARAQTSRRRFVPRIMGPLSATESKYDLKVLGLTNFPEGTSWAGAELDPATYLTLCLPAEGADIDNRIGRKISVYRIAIRGIIHTAVLQDQTDMLLAPSYRLILYIDQQTNGGQSQAEDIMSTGLATQEGVFTGFQNLNNLGRFRVLKDIIFEGRDVSSMTDGASTASIGAGDIPFKISYKFKDPLVIKFNSTNGGTIADIIDNSFHLIGAKSTADFAGTITYQCRTYYKDY